MTNLPDDFRGLPGEKIPQDVLDECDDACAFAENLRTRIRSAFFHFETDMSKLIDSFRDRIIDDFDKAATRDDFYIIAPNFDRDECINFIDEISDAVTCVISDMENDCTFIRSESDIEELIIERAARD